MRHHRTLLAVASILALSGCAETEPESVVDQEDRAIANCQKAWQERYPEGQVRGVTITGDGGYTYLVEARLKRASGGATVQCIARSENDWAPTGRNDLYLTPDY
ncbi:hypothetical protein Q9S36_49810 [Microbacterium sp. ARD31]|uniref:hypothetical protein n=1 Tax=Microbacterium sp. ARD31 TaxID=2962576 RepID=UPI002881F06F|nr:hypothetical protein [Microbacterium sp. ARD31]MDT0188314.1 hypothetical protein [Microbacterium sp. ARD31]